MQLLRLDWLGTKDFEQKQAGTDDDGGVGYVEVRPMVVDDPDLEEVDDVGEADAVVEIAERSAEDEAERDAAEGEDAAHLPDHAEDDEDGDDGEGDKAVADEDRREGLGEE